MGFPRFEAPSNYFQITCIFLFKLMSDNSSQNVAVATYGLHGSKAAQMIKDK